MFDIIIICPIFKACSSGSMEIVHVLLSNGADVRPTMQSLEQPNNRVAQVPVHLKQNLFSALKLQYDKYVSVGYYSPWNPTSFVFCSQYILRSYHPFTVNPLNTKKAYNANNWYCFTCDRCFFDTDMLANNTNFVYYIYHIISIDKFILQLFLLTVLILAAFAYWFWEIHLPTVYRPSYRLFL